MYVYVAFQKEYFVFYIKFWLCLYERFNILLATGFTPLFVLSYKIHLCHSLLFCLYSKKNSEFRLAVILLDVLPFLDLYPELNLISWAP